MLNEIFKNEVNFKGEDYYKLNDEFSYKPGDIFIGSIDTTIKKDGKKSHLKKRKGTYLLSMIQRNSMDSKYDKYLLQELDGEVFVTSKKGMHLFKNVELIKEQVQRIGTKIKDITDKLKISELKKEVKALTETGFSLNALDPEEQINKLITAGQKNIWMVGPAGCGKSTIARLVAEKRELPYLCVSCGIGTSSTEFVGYKYPNRESTKFAEYYGKPSIILIDEITALDPSVGQILNASLANDEIETTTGLVTRDPNCIIIATSNTFGTGGDRMYVANNQLDASTLDRFVGGILKVDYSEKYESQYDIETVAFANLLRNAITASSMRRIISTRFIQSASHLKKAGVKDWKESMLINWSSRELTLLQEYCKSTKGKKDELSDIKFYHKPINSATRGILVDIVNEIIDKYKVDDGQKMAA